MSEPENTPVNTEAEEVNYESEGLSAKLAEFRAANPPESFEEAPEPVAAETPPATPAAAVAATTDDEEPEIEFPEIGVKPTEPDAKPFDEAAFDKETEDEIKGLDPKQTGAWKKIKERVKAAEKKAAELSSAAPAKPAPEVEAELARLKTLEQEAEGLRQRNQELLRANDQTAMRESDEFKKAVTAPLDEMANIIRTMAEASEIDPSTLAAIIEETDIGKQDKMIDALGSKLSPRALNRVERLADDFKAITHKERELLAEAGTKLEAQRIARQAAEKEEQGRRVTAFKAAVTDAFKTYAAAVPGFTDSSGALTDLGEAILAKTSTVDINNLGPDDLGYLAYTANALPEMRRELVKLRTENSILKGSKPRSDVAAGAAPSTPREDPDLEEDGMPQGLMARMKGVKFAPVGAV
jgi:hypothetical protein